MTSGLEGVNVNNIIANGDHSAALSGELFIYLSWFVNKDLKHQHND